MIINAIYIFSWKRDHTRKSWVFNYYTLVEMISLQTNKNIALKHIKLGLRKSLQNSVIIIKTSFTYCLNYQDKSDVYLSKIKTMAALYLNQQKKLFCKVG